MAILVQNLVNAPHHLRISLHISRQAIKVGKRRNRVLLILTAVQERHDIVYGGQRALQVEQLLHIQTSVLNADAFQRRSHIEKVLVGKILLLQDAHKLHRLLHLFHR